MVDSFLVDLQAELIEESFAVATVSEIYCVQTVRASVSGIVLDDFFKFHQTDEC